jgi:hypothetical protein
VNQLKNPPPVFIVVRWLFLLLQTQLLERAKEPNPIAALAVLDWYKSERPLNNGPPLVLRQGATHHI